MENNETVALKLINSVIELPRVKINRNEFLYETFKDEVDDYERLISEGPAAFFTKEKLDLKVDKIINNELLKSTSVSNLTGLPGGFALAATIPADVYQFYGYSLRLAQMISYVYGYENILDDNSQLTVEGQNTLVIYFGIMLGVNVAGSSIRLLSSGLAQQLPKTISNKALTKTIYYPIIKKTLKMLGIKVTKQSFGKSVSKAVPFIGGGVSGGLNYVAFKSLAFKLKAELGKIIDYTQEDYENDINIIDAEISESVNTIEAETIVNETINETKIDQLERANDLFNKGVLNQEEFECLKKEILAA